MSNRIDLFEPFEGDLDDYKAYMNRVSDFIREFEQKLLDSNVHAVYEYAMSETQRLAWDKVHGKRRLIYNDVEKKIDDRPLIECKIHIRMECVRHLKPFMAKIVAKLKEEMGE